MRLPLQSWRIYAKKLPERLAGEQKEEAFFLPGADALSAFSDLFGGNEADTPAAQESCADYDLCGLFEEDISGAVTLKKDVDFGALTGDRAVLIHSTSQEMAEFCSAEMRLRGLMIRRRTRKNCSMPSKKQGFPAGSVLM